jgi:hypothetical protein
MKNEDEYQKKEAEVLAALRSQPDVWARHEPPAGYETQLLSALKRQLPLESAAALQTQKQSTPKTKRWLWELRLGWAFAGVLGGFAAFAFFRGNFGLISQEPVDGVLAQAVRSGGVSEVDAWAASMGDRAVQKRWARADFDTVAEGANNKVMDQALQQVAREMGMK